MVSLVELTTHAYEVNRISFNLISSLNVHTHRTGTASPPMLSPQLHARTPLPHFLLVSTFVPCHCDCTLMRLCGKPSSHRLSSSLRGLSAYAHRHAPRCRPFPLQTHASARAMTTMAGRGAHRWKLPTPMRIPSYSHEYGQQCTRWRTW
jgi:hypothetical protein